MAQTGVNPHAAADLLRQAMAQNSARHEKRDEHHDQIGTESPTPSGIETPRPDFHDKRLPGILPSYFGQVGGEPSSSSPLQSPQVITTPAVDFGFVKHSPKLVDGVGKSQNSSSASLVKVEHDALADADQMQQRAASSKPDSLEQSSESISSEPYEVQEDVEAADNGMPVADSGLSSITQALRSLVSPKSTFSSKTTRHQSLPLSSINTNPVSAAHISNPTSTAHTPRLQSPSYTPPLSEGRETSPSVQELSKLTLGAASESREKTNTPPMTPRALSTEGRVSGTKSPLSSTSATASEDTHASHSQETSRRADLPTAGSRGKLTVSIAEGRNIKPAVDPYCVCVFEWNEYISKGPKSDKMDVDEPEEKKGAVPQLSSIPIKRTDSDMGKPMAIPMRSRQSSTNGTGEGERMQTTTAPQWDHEAVFDVTGQNSEIDISVYDHRANQDNFLGHVRLTLNLSDQQPAMEKWLALEPRGSEDKDISGEIHIKMHFSKTEKRQFGPNDFQILKLIGKGTFGQVYQVRKKDTQRIYAMKVLSKKVIIQKKEIAHTIGERNILVRTAMADSAFIVGLKFSFQTATDLYLVTDFMSGGELFWHLQKEGRFKEDRAKFYIAELILALKHLHEHDIVYRDLKPENILLDANGHIALCDFGLSKANLTQNDTTNTFCGTTEYLAPEVLLDEQGYTKMVDFWSLGVLVFEMCCGWSPFYAEDTQQMYKNIAFGKVRFPRDALSTEGRNFVKGLLNRNPKHRLGANRDAEELIEHPFFADVDWDALAKKNLVPPFKPKLSSQSDTSNFDPEFTNALNTSSSLNARAAALAAGADPGSTPLSPTMQNAFRGFTFVDESAMDQQFGGQDDDQYDDSSLTRTKTNENRMSGIQRTSGGDDIFSGDGDWNM